MRVFLSWSGNKSRQLAEIFSSWLPSVLQLINPYFTPDDIEKGTRWFIDVSGELDACDSGLLFLTQENLTAPWIMFEAGALSKKFDKGRVSPLLFGINTTDLQGPLVQFQATRFNKSDVYKLVANLNNSLGEHALSEGVLDNTFEKWWPELEAKVSKVMSSDNATSQVVRLERDLIEETLQLVRGMAASDDRLIPDSTWHRVTNHVNQLLATVEGLDRQLMFEDGLVHSQYHEATKTLRAQILSIYDVLDPEGRIHAPLEKRTGRRIHTLDDLIELWPFVLARVKRKVGFTGVAYLADARPVELSEKEAVLEFQKEFHYEKACEAAKRLPLERVINECLASPHLLRLQLASQNI